MAEKNLVSEFSSSVRRTLIDMEHPELSISTQAELLDVNRSILYYRPVQPSEEDLYVKMLIDKVFTKYPMYDYRRICWYLNEKKQYHINHKAVLRLMREMEIQAIYPRQNTSTPDPENKVYLYLLKNLKIDHPNQVWSIDITYIPVKTDWLYLVVIIDWHSRYILGWQLCFCLLNLFSLAGGFRSHCH